VRRSEHGEEIKEWHQSSHTSLKEFLGKGQVLCVSSLVVVYFIVVVADLFIVFCLFFFLCLPIITLFIEEEKMIDVSGENPKMYVKLTFFSPPKKFKRNMRGTRQVRYFVRGSCYLFIGCTTCIPRDAGLGVYDVDELFPRTDLVGRE
jgi:hypothetical protein